MKRRGGFFIFAFFILLVIAGCGKEGDSSPPSAGGPPVEDTPGGNLPSTKISRIKITPGAFLLTQPGETVQLSAQAYDADGQPIDATITWKTSNEAALTITPEGLATAEAGVGSAQITAQAEGISSGPVLALLAQPVSGAILVKDDQVIGIPEAVDPAAPYGLGWRYRATLSGINLPNPGEILVSVGEAAIGGRVIEAAQNGDAVTVTLEIVSLEALFVDLKIRESIDLSRADYQIDPEIAATYDVRRLPDGRIQFTPKPDQPAPKPERQAPAMAPSNDQFSLGPFKCNATVNVNLIPIALTEQAELTFLPDLSVDFDYDSSAGGLQKLAANGTLETSAKVGITLSPGVEGKVTCKAKMLELPVTPPGPVGLLFGGKLSIEAGFEPSGKVSYSLGLKATVDTKSDFQVGVDCGSGDCQMIGELTGEAPHKEIKPVIPDGLSDFSTEMNMRAFGYIGVKIGNPWLESLQFEAFKVEYGPKLRLKLASVEAQAGDPDSASEYQLLLFSTVGAGVSLTEFMNFLQITFIKLEIQAEAVVDDSPKGNLTITPATVTPGDGSQIGQLATFTVTLDSSTFLGMDVVEWVEIKWLKDGVLESGLPGCAILPASSGQTVFTCQASFLVEHIGEQKFYAFVKADLFGLPLSIPLEVASNSEEIVTVGGGPAVRLVTREHSMDTTFTASGPISYVPESFSVKYAGSATSTTPYSDSLSPEVVVTRDNEVTLSSSSNQGISFITDATGGLTDIIGAGQILEARIQMPTCSIDNLCLDQQPDQNYVGGATNEGSMQNNVIFEVQGGPVTYHLSGTVTAQATAPNFSPGGHYDQTLIIGEVALSRVSEVRACAPASLCEDIPDSPPPTATFSSDGILQPGLYSLVGHFWYRVDGSSALVADTAGVLSVVGFNQQGSGNFNFTLSFAPAP